MLFNKNRKPKLSVTFIIGFSIILISLAAALSITSVRSVKDLGNFAINIDKKNNIRISSKMFLEVTKRTANEYSAFFDDMADYAVIISMQLQNDILNLSNINKAYLDNLNLTQLNNSNFFTNDSQEINAFCWESGYPSEKIKSSIYRFLSLLPSYKSIYNRNINDILNIWTIGKENFSTIYPYNNFYKDEKRRISYIKDYNFLKKIAEKKFKSNDPNVRWTVPYKDVLTNKNTMTVFHPIFDKSGSVNLITGIDLNLENIVKKILKHKFLYDENLDNSTEKTKQNNITGFVFIISQDGNIISLPSEYYHMFSLPKKYKYTNLYRYDSLPQQNLSESNDPEIQNLLENMMKNKTGVKHYEIKDRDYIIAHCKIDSTGWVLGYAANEEKLMTAALKTNEQMHYTENKLNRNFIFTTLFFLCLSVILAILFFKRYFLHPIERIKNGIKKMGDGDFQINLSSERTSELSVLSSAFNYLGKEIREYMVNLREEVTARQAIETEVKIAANLQLSILPETTIFINNEYFEIETKLIPAKDVSGDFYDFFFLDNDKVAVIIADVSGKGLSAAFFMAMSKILIKNYCLENPNNPGKVLEKVNKALCMDNKAQMFVTVSLAIYNFKTGISRYVEAGHHPAIIVRNGQVSKSEKMHSIALGIYENAEFKSRDVTVNVGDMSIFYTDGVTEAPSPDNEEYGESRLINLISKNKDKPLDSLCNIITKDVTDFECKNRFDDITLVTFRRLK